MDQEQGKERKAGRAEDGGQRNIAAEKKDEEEDGDGGEGGTGGGDEEDAKAGGYALAAAEAELDGEHVAENGREGGEGFEVAHGDGGGEMDGEQCAEPDGGRAFEHVEEEGGCA